MTPQKIIRFVWGNPPVPGGRWRGGVLNLRQIVRAAQSASPEAWHDYRRHHPHVSLRGALLWSMGLAFVAYFAGAAYLVHRFETRYPENKIGYLDLVLPHRWSQLDRLRGEALVAQGRAALAAGRFADGFSQLRMGLARHPADHAARFEIARMYLALRLRPQTHQLLRDGFAHGYPGRQSLELLFALAAEADRPADWIALARLARERLDAIPVTSRPPGEDRWLDRQVANALLAAGRTSEAVAHVAARYPENDPFRREITALDHLAAGRAADAVSTCIAWAGEQPAAPEPLRLLARACREAGDLAGLDAALERLRALNPARPGPLLYAFLQRHLAGQRDQADVILEQLLLRHGAALDLYQALAVGIIEIKAHAYLDRIETELRERGLSPNPVLWAKLQLACDHHDWPAVIPLAESLRNQRKTEAPSPAQIAWLETILRLARACQDPASATQAALVDHLADHPGDLPLYRIVLNALLDGARPETADKVLNLAEASFADADSIVALRPRIEAARSAARSTPPPPPTPAPTIAGHAGEAAFFADFNRRIQDKDTDGALALLASVRRARPDWLAAASARLDALELPLRALGEDPSRLPLLARSVLTRDSRAPDNVLALARTAHAAGRTEHALILLRELLRRVPAHAEALALLAEWAPPADNPKPAAPHS